MDDRKKLIFVNCIIAIDVIAVALIGIIFGAGDGQVGDYVIGLGYFKPYTMDSNILTGIVAIMVVVYNLKNMRDDTKQMPKWLVRAYLMCTTSLILTFLIAATFLAPIKVMSGNNYFSMFSGDMFFFHFLNPLLASVSLIMLLRGYRFTFVDRFVGMLPTIAYSIVYFVMVVVVKSWNDFYHFTFGGKYYMIPIVVVAIYGITYACSYLLVLSHNHFVEK